jgi:Cyclin D1 binding domain
MHGGEFLLFLQRNDVHIEAIKISGDTNVPCGEYSWVTYLDRETRVCEEPEFFGSQAVEGLGQIALQGFFMPQSTPVEGIFAIPAISP